MNRIFASFTLLLGLACLMLGVYAEQWNTIRDLVIKFVPVF
ncbi:MAG TPA: hypothetical protein VE177_02045 [Candidatus Binatus sp.]|nr:hypothetical protein [Candidatus Binatus sp.]